MRIVFRFSVLLFVLASVVVLPLETFAATPELSGNMAPWQRIVGRWICAVRLVATDNRPAEEEGLVHAVGSVAPGNVFHLHLLASGVEIDAYDGYSETAKSWWEAQADTKGYATLMRSLDGVVFDQLSDASSSIESDPAKYREIYRFHNSDSFSQLTQIWVAGSWHPDSEMGCRRSDN